MNINHLPADEFTRAAAAAAESGAIHDDAEPGLLCHDVGGTSNPPEITARGCPGHCVSTILCALRVRVLVKMRRPESRIASTSAWRAAAMAAPRDASGAEGEVPAFESLPVEGETYNCTLGAEASVAVAEATMTWTTARQKIVIAIFFFFPKMQRFSIYNVKRKEGGWRWLQTCSASIASPVDAGSAGHRRQRAFFC